MLTQAAKVDITFVPFTGYTPAIQAGLTTLQGQLQTSTLRALATAAARVPLLPNVPTVNESGYKEHDYSQGPITVARSARLTYKCTERVSAMEGLADHDWTGRFPGRA